MFRLVIFCIVGKQNACVDISHMLYLTMDYGFNRPDIVSIMDLKNVDVNAAIHMLMLQSTC